MLNSLQAPRGTTLSRRLIFLLMGLFMVISALFVVFLKIYSPHGGMIKSAEVSESSDNEASLSMIHKIGQENSAPLVKPSSVQKTSPSNSLLTNAPDKTLLNSNLSEDMKAASNASVDVYHDHGAGDFQREENDNSNESSNATPVNEKAGFLQSQQTQNPDVIGAQLKSPNSAYEVKAGAILPATLMTGIQSDLPGTIIAKIRQNIYDTVSGNYLLIPQGTTLIGTYDSQVAFGQKRVLIAWSRLIFPNGSSFDLLGMPGADLMGRSGLQDQIDNHYMRIFGSSLMLSLFGAAGQLSQPQNHGLDLSTQQILFGAVGQQMTQTAAQLMEKNLNIQPTINIRPGARFNVLLTKDLVLPRPYAFQ